MEIESRTIVPTSAINGAVYIVDDDENMRRFVSVLARSIGLGVEAYSSAAKFMEHFRESSNVERPGCLILDVRMPGMSGLELQKQLSSSQHCPPIIFLSAFGEIPLATQAMRAGAVDFLCKPFSCQSLLERIREAIDLDREQRERVASSHAIQERAASLTTREREIAKLLAAGQSTKQIAQSLAISSKTVDNHRAKVLEKMRVDNTTQLSRLLVMLDSK